jgi:3-phosphoshikimate 1-carboxyvinyltransferase
MKPRLLPGPISKIDAAVEVPSSKSLTNRALVVAAAAGGGRVVRPLDCEDTRLLADALAQAGWDLRWMDEIVVGDRRRRASAAVDLGNSGTGSRLILGLLACIPGRFVVDGTPRLRQRPMAPLLDALAALGADVTSNDGYLPVKIAGGDIAGGEVVIRPGASSQFISSLLLAAPLMRRGLDLRVEGPVPSRPYLELTREILVQAGAEVTGGSNGGWKVAAGGLRPTTFEIEGDWSAVAFAAAAVAVAGGEVSISPLAADSAQGDRAVCGVLESAGLDISIDGDRLRLRGAATRPFDADLTDTPDLFPAISVVAVCCPPGTTLRGVRHLKHKESDRLSVMIDNLGRLGARFERSADGVRVVRGLDRGSARGQRVTAADDHRIAMSMAVAALAAGPLELDDEACVAKSFPEFWSMWRGLVGDEVLRS